MNILIVSGFLGAGKTTFIKELIRRTGTNPVILENESPKVLAETESAIRNINPNAGITSSHYTRQSDEWWRSVLAIPAQDINVIESGSDADEFSQLTLNNASLKNPAQLIMLLEDCLRGNMGRIVRAKGTLPVGKETLRFDLADNLYTISDSSQEINQCVFIGRDLDIPKICKRMECLFEKKVSLARAYVSRQK